MDRAPRGAQGRANRMKPYAIAAHFESRFTGWAFRGQAR
jgi:hypothetical protein